MGALRLAAEGLAAHAAFALFRALPVDAASALGGRLAGALGPRLPASGRARDNLRLAFPSLDDREVARLVAAMWDNLGRVVGEFPHLRRLARERVEIVGREHLLALRDDGLPGLIFSGHLGNWEVLVGCAGLEKLPLTLVYRAANNPHVERLYQKGRRDLGGDFLPKGAEGARGALKALRDGRHLGMLVDQKMNDGIAVPFFGRPAMTAPALAQFALRLRCPVLPARVERLGGARFRVTVEPPLALPDSGDRQADALALMTAVNARLEGWIRERPEQWLWLHRRWPSCP